MKVFCYYQEEGFLKEFPLDVDVSVSKKKKKKKKKEKRDMCTLLLKVQCQSTNLLINLLNLSQRSWEKEKNFSWLEIELSKVDKFYEMETWLFFFEKKQNGKHCVRRIMW